MKNYLDIALKYHRAGFRCIPVTETKAPACGSWKRFMEAQSEKDIRDIFARDSHGIALLMGIGGLECIDVDEKYSLDGQLMAKFMRLNDEVNANSAPFTSLTVVRTTSGGYHVLYRCDAPEGNQKLANRPATEEERKGGDTVKVLIETRGVGGYIVACPTPGYEVEFGRMSDIPHISMGQRLDILRCAKMFDETPVMAPSPLPPASPAYAEGDAPWEKYNETADGVSLLQAHGWSVVYEDRDRVYLRRPGDTKAKTSGNWHKMKRLFVSHSTSTAFDAAKGYTAYGIYTVLEHRSDFSASAKALLQSGYGSAPQRPAASVPAPHGIPEAKPIVDPKAEEEALRAFIRSTRFDITAPIKEDKATLLTHIGGKAYKLAGPGMIVGVVGPQKSSKTSIVAAITASAISQREQPILSFGMDIEGKKAVYFDTEQSAYFYQRTQEMIHRMAGLYANSDKYHAYHLRRLSADQRLRGIDLELAGRKDLGLIVIDGLVDLLVNFNSETESARVMEYLLKWSDETKAMIVTVLHLTKADGFMRGHLGTALQNKYDAGIQVNKDGEDSIFRVKCRDSRFAPFQPFEFTKDEFGYPVFEGGPTVVGADFTQALEPTPAMFPIEPRKRAEDEDVPF
jgi:hypothetical protein